MESTQPEVEQLRAALRALGPKGARALAVKLGLEPETVSKFRRGHIKDPGASKFAALQAALLTAKSVKPSKPVKTAKRAKPDTGKRRRSTDTQAGAN